MKKNLEKLIKKTKEKRRQSRESDSCPQTHGSFTIKEAKQKRSGKRDVQPEKKDEKNKRIDKRTSEKTP